MTLHANFKAVPYLFVALGSLCFAILARGRRPGLMARSFGWMMAGDAVWAGCNALVLILVEWAPRSACRNVGMLGAVTAILGMVACVLESAGRGQWLNWRRFAAICALPLLLVALAWTDPLHHLYWTDPSARADEITAIDRGFGPGSWLHLAVCYLLMAASAYFLIEAVFLTSGVYRTQSAIMLLGLIVPWVVSVLEMRPMLGGIDGDSTALAFVATGIAFLPALDGFHRLAPSAAAWTRVVEKMDDPAMVVDPWRRLVDLNPAACRLVDRPREELLGLEVRRAFQWWPGLVERIERPGASLVGSFEVASPVPPTTLFIGQISGLGDGDDSAGWVLVLRDITAQRRTHEQRVRGIRERAALAAAEANNRAKDRFIATVSHELRTPLTPVLATVSAMLGDDSTPASLRPILEMIDRNVTLEARLIEDLLDLSRINGGKLKLAREAVDLRALIRRVVDICAHDIESAGLDLQLEESTPRPLVDADPVRLQQVLWNLIKNAIQFTPAGGIITIRTDERRGAGPDGAGDAVVVEVHDTGIGIDPEALPRVFDTFMQGEDASTRRHGGLGLGLAISRAIVERHGGRLRALSRGRGHGATFALELPAAAGEPTIPEPPRPAASPRFRILLVDDNKDTLQYLGKMLTLRGHAVSLAASVRAARRLVDGREFDLLISDIDLPDGSGLDLMRELAAPRGMRGIALSGLGTGEDVALSLSMGYDQHLTKPVTFPRLDEAIRGLAAEIGPGGLEPG